MKKEHRNIAENRKAFHEYFILDKYEAGISLQGPEVKSIRAGKVNLKESYVAIRQGEMFIEGMHISPYEFGNRNNPDPIQSRKLLMHKREILRIGQQIKEKGLTLVPLRLYFKGDKIKVEIGLARGKKLYDKRMTEAKKSAERDINRALSAGRKGR